MTPKLRLKLIQAVATLRATFNDTRDEKHAANVYRKVAGWCESDAKLIASARETLGQAGNCEFFSEFEEAIAEFEAVLDAAIPEVKP
jgi:hypothetical protein